MSLSTITSMNSSASSVLNLVNQQSEKQIEPMQSNFPLNAMQNLCLATVQSQLPIQKETNKTIATFQKFMKEQQTLIEKLMTANVELRQELTEIKQQMKEKDQVHQAEQQASQQVIQQLANTVLETNKRVEQLESEQTTLKSQFETQTVKPSEIKAMREKIGALIIQLLKTQFLNDIERQSIANQIQLLSGQMGSIRMSISSIKREYDQLLEKFNKHAHPCKYYMADACSNSLHNTYTGPMLILN